jgi:hypothetical protein
VRHLRIAINRTGRDHPRKQNRNKHQATLHANPFLLPFPPTPSPEPMGRFRMPADVQQGSFITSMTRVFPLIRASFLSSGDMMISFTSPVTRECSTFCCFDINAPARAQHLSAHSAAWVSRFTRSTSTFLLKWCLGYNQEDQHARQGTHQGAGNALQAHFHSVSPIYLHHDNG